MKINCAHFLHFTPRTLFLYSAILKLQILEEKRSTYVLTEKAGFESNQMIAEE